VADASAKLYDRFELVDRDLRRSKASLMTDCKSCPMHRSCCVGDCWFERRCNARPDQACGNLLDRSRPLQQHVAVMHSWLFHPWAV